MRRFLLFLLLVSLLLPAGCSASSSPSSDSPVRPWQTGDLRLLDPLDAPSPSLDIVAAYARLSGPDLQVRLDLLDVPDPASFELFLALDTQPGGSVALPGSQHSDLDWEYLLRFHTTYLSSFVDNRNQPVRAGNPHLFYDPLMDEVVLRLNLSALGVTPNRIRLQAFIAPTGSDQIADRTAIFDFDGPPPSGKAPLLLAFWDALPAVTPVQALRGWDGAHAGPNGTRHGLRWLLEAASANRVPLALLDLKNPSSLTALDAVDGLPLVKSLSDRGLLLLPDTVFGDPQAASESLRLGRQVSASYGLSSSPFLFGPAPLPLPGGCQAAFTAFGTQPFLPSDGVRLIPLPGWNRPDAGQVTADSLSLPARQSLVQTALSPNPPLTVLGGSLPASAWANQSTADILFAYIAAHPWINPLDGAELLAFPAQLGSNSLGCADLLCSPALPTSSPAFPGLDFSALRSSLRQQLSALPPSPTRDLAWQTYLQLTSPSADPARAVLQANYLGQAGYLIQTVRWQQNPSNRSDCGEDVDLDGEKECILSSQELFAILKPDGARLVYAASHQGQIVAPSSQVAVGQGDPSEWKLDQRQDSDPRVLPGAFYDSPDPYLPYTPTLGSDQITFTSTDGLRQKIYSLLPDGLKVEYRMDKIDARVALTVTPQALFQPGWSERYSLTTSSDRLWLHWPAETSPRVALYSSVPPDQANTFRDSAAWMRQPEDPDHAYPPGHYLPFPWIVFEYTAKHQLVVRLYFE